MKNIDQKDLRKYCLNLDLIETTAAQIKKDFALFDETIKFSGNPKTAYNELYLQIYPMLDRMIAGDRTKFFAILYAIDIDENKARSVLFDNQRVAAIEQITKLIIERELIKIVYRRHWSASFKNE